MTGFLLFNVTNSEHIHKNIKMFEKFGLKCNSFHLFSSAFFLKKIDVLYLNWFENIYHDFALIAFMKFFLHMFILWYSNVLGIHVVASFHNKETHTSNFPKLEKIIFKYVFKVADKIIIFSESSRKDLVNYLSLNEIDEKCFYIPPVNYIGSYPYCEKEWIHELEERSGLKLLFAGSLHQSYKNVEMVMEIAKELKNVNIQFVFAGKVKDEKQKAYYSSKVKGLKNVTTVFRYIEDDEMAHLLKMCDIVIIPYNVESISNSGTARLAFSYGRTVICPEIPSLSEIPHELIYSYTYSDSKNHYEVVRSLIEKANSEYKKDNKIFKNMGEKLKEIMIERNSPDVVSERYFKLFQSLGL